MKQFTLEQLQEQLKDRQEQFRVYQAKADAVREQIRVIQESIDALIGG
jgi:flagellum-specific peptidoglycan hydrolase FlgJ